MRLSPTIMPHQSVPTITFTMPLPYLSNPTSSVATTRASDRQTTGHHQQRVTNASHLEQSRSTGLRQTSFFLGYHLSSQVVQSACRAFFSVNLRERRRANHFGSQITFSSSAVEDGRCPTFLLSLCLCQRDLVCLLDGGLDDLLLFGGEGGGKLSVELGLGLGQGWKEILLANCGSSKGESVENLH